MVTTAAIIAGGTVAAAGIGASSSKKAEGGGQSALDQILAQTLTETTPIREQVIERILNAFSGESPSAIDPILQQKKSSITASGERQKSKLKGELAKTGLEGSSVGIAGIENINRMVANLLANVDTSELERLTQLGESLSFGQPIQTATTAASALANAEAIAAGRSDSTGQSIGKALALLYQSQAGRTTVPTVGAPSDYSIPESDPTVSAPTTLFAN